MTNPLRLDNLKTTYNRWRERQHPLACEVCSQIWGPSGAPSTFEGYAARYPSLEHGAKRHLTQPFNTGLTIREVASRAGCKPKHVQDAIENGMLEATEVEGRLFVSRTNATLWSTKGAPVGESSRSWVSLRGAQERYGFTEHELLAFLKSGQLKYRTAAEHADVAGSQPGEILVSRRQCGQLRDQLGYTAEHAARRLGVPLAALAGLLEGLNWRSTGDLIPLSALRSAAKRLGERPPQRVAAVSNEPGWLTARDALALAGVSKAILGRWTTAGDVRRKSEAGGWRYFADDVTACACEFWRNNPHRTDHPGWFEPEPSPAPDERLKA